MQMKITKTKTKMDNKKNEELKKKIEEKKKIMLSQARDKHFMEKLFNDVISLKAQMAVEPAHHYVGLNEVIDTMEGDEYRIHALNNGVHFETKGGLDIFIDAKYTAACGFLTDIVATRNMVESLSDEDKSAYYTSLKNVMYVLCAPLWVLGSQSMTTFLGNTLLVMLSAQQDWMSQDDKDEANKPVPTLNIALKVREMCNMLIGHINSKENKEEPQSEEKDEGSEQKEGE